jgi:hypothetical protein
LTHLQDSQFDSGLVGNLDTFRIKLHPQPFILKKKFIHAEKLKHSEHIAFYIEPAFITVLLCFNSGSGFFFFFLPMSHVKLNCWYQDSLTSKYFNSYLFKKWYLQLGAVAHTCNPRY